MYIYHIIMILHTSNGPSVRNEINIVFKFKVHFNKLGSDFLIEPYALSYLLGVFLIQKSLINVHSFVVHLHKVHVNICNKFS